MGICSFTTAEAPFTGVFARAHRFDRPFTEANAYGRLDRCYTRLLLHEVKASIHTHGLPNKHFLVKGGETP